VTITWAVPGAQSRDKFVNVLTPNILYSFIVKSTNVHQRCRLLKLENTYFSIVTWRLKAGIVEPEQMSIARQGLGEQISVEMKSHAALEQPFLCNGEVNTSIQEYRYCWEAEFSMRTMPRCYKETSELLSAECSWTLQGRLGRDGDPIQLRICSRK
jgi:hypothetical protein